MKEKNNPPIYTPLQGSKSDENNENSTNNSDNSCGTPETCFEQGLHPNSVKALKKHQYPKGVSGNVMGRKPTFESLGKMLSKLGNEETFDYSNKSMGTRKSQVLKRIWHDAMRGDMKKIQLLAWLRCLD